MLRIQTGDIVKCKRAQHKMKNNHTDREREGGRECSNEKIKAMREKDQSNTPLHFKKHTRLIYTETRKSI